MNKLKCIYINLLAMFCADQSVLKGIPVLKILLTDNFRLQSRAASGTGACSERDQNFTRCCVKM